MSDWTDWNSDGEKKLDHSYIACENVKWLSYSRKYLTVIRNETKPKMKHAATTQPTQGTPGIFPGKLKLFISGFIQSSQNQDNLDVLWQVNS